MYTDAARNNMITAEGTTHLSLHTAYSVTGANELAGGSPAYARKAVTFAAASGGAKALAAEVTFDVPAATVLWEGRWTALTGGTFLGMSPVHGVAVEFWCDLAANTIIAPAHGRANGDQVVFYGAAPPGGLTEGTVYFVVGATTDTFQVAATSGGAAIDLTAYHATRCVMSRIIPEVYGAQGQLKVPVTYELNVNL